MLREAALPSGLVAGLLGEHLFTHIREGDGVTEQPFETFGCSCGNAHYALWVQEHPGLPGHLEFLVDRPVHEQTHAGHLAHVLQRALELAWDAGRAAGEAAARQPTRIDLAGDKNPHRSPPAPAITEVRYPGS